MPRIGLITAGLGSINHILAGRRVAEAAKKFSGLSFIKSYEDSDLNKFAPMVSKEYAGTLNSLTKGYGYFAWKPELVLSTLRNPDLDLDMVIWVDAGCELNSNAITRARFSSLVNRSLKRGYYFYDLDYPEEQYTKRDVLLKFPNVSSKTRQVQATFFMVTKAHVQLIENWTTCVLENIKNIDLSPSLDKESASFIEHRFDQSLLSLIVKTENLEISNSRPFGGINSLRSLLHGLISPVWTIRNRTGDSLVSDQIKSFFFKQRNL